MGGGDLNLKKSWHPSTMKNIEKVWKAEQKNDQEQKRIAELQREIREERAREDLQKLAEEKGVIEKKDDMKLEWMYKGPRDLIDREEYLLGRKVDKTFEELEIADKASSSAAKVPSEHDSLSSSALSAAALQVDLARKLQEDPLYAIKKKEIETKNRILSNPVKLKQLQKLLKQQVSNKKNKKKKKKKQNSESDSESDLDKLLLAKYSKLKRKLKTDKLHSLKNITSDSSDNDSDERHASKSRKVVSQSYCDNSKQKKDKLKTKECSSQLSDIDGRRGSEYPSKKENHRNKSQSNDNEVERKRSTIQKRRHRSRSSTDDEVDIKRSFAINKDRRRHRSSSSESKRERRAGSTRNSRREHRSSVEKRRETSSSKKQSCESESSSDETINRNTNDYKNKSKEKNWAGRDVKSTPRPEHTLHKNKYGNQSTSEEDERKSRRITKEKERYESDSFSDDSAKDEKSDLQKGYGLVLPESKKSNYKKELMSDRTRRGKESTGDKMLRYESVRNKPPPKYEKKKLSEEEIEKRRHEMMNNAKWRETVREVHISRYKAQEKKEKDDAKAFDSDFLRKNLAYAASQETVERRIKSNIYNIQRSHASMDKNFARR